MSDSSIPQHVGIILDGNRRWASARGLPVTDGHRYGADNLQVIAKAAFERGVKYLSAYVFSTENWSRAQEEVSYLMGLVSHVTDKYLNELHQAGVRVVLVGQRAGLDRKVLAAIEKGEALTNNNQKGTLALCFNYGGQQEIVDAAKALLHKQVSPDGLTAETFARALYAPELPPLDLVIRTSGEQRTSGFMLYRAAYAELYFTEALWPDFTPADFDKALEIYAERQRRFGH